MHTNAFASREKRERELREARIRNDDGRALILEEARKAKVNRTRANMQRNPGYMKEKQAGYKYK